MQYQNNISWISVKGVIRAPVKLTLGSGCLVRVEHLKAAALL